VDQARQLKELEQESAELKRLIADLLDLGQTSSITTLSVKDHLSDPPRPRSKRRFLSR
jgi:K+-sensing histidine kinase KdpD